MKASPAIIPLLLAALLSAGCPPTDTQQVRPQPPETLTDEELAKGRTLFAGDGGNERGAHEERYLLLVRMRMFTIEVPVGTVSGSEDLWSYLDEEPIDSVRLSTLARNGFRIGRGRRDTWPDVAAILSRLTGRPLKATTLHTKPGSVVPIVLKQDQPEQTIFTFFDDRTLSGADYPAGDNLLSVYCTVNYDQPTELIVTGMPQLRSSYRKPKVIRDAGPLRLVRKPVHYTFQPLLWQIPVNSRDFIMIGPGTQSRRPNSVGRHFLNRTKGGMEFETVLVLLPEVFATLVD
jgi:hypothetical protein